MSYPLVNIQKNLGKSPFLMGKLTISMAIFNSFLYVYLKGYGNHRDIGDVFPMADWIQWLKPMCPICSLPWQKN
jgi:hypothetical protein